MRRGELAGLRWVDIDFANARVSPQRPRVVVDYAVQVSEPKTAKGRRALALDPATLTVLREQVTSPGGTTASALRELEIHKVRAAFLAAGATLVSVPVDNHGLCVEQLPGRIGIVCVTPSHQSPTGAVLSTPRRQALLAYARRHDAVVVEDDYDGEFRFGGRPLDALQTLDLVYVMTNGGPLRRTTTMVYHIYQTAFKNFDMGYASAVAYFLFAVLFVLTLMLGPVMIVLTIPIIFMAQAITRPDAPSP